MTNNQFKACVAEVENYTDRDAYISDLALSDIWEDAEDVTIPEQRVEALGQIWDACHRTIKQIASDAGLSNRKLAERFCIPYRTVEDWSANCRESPLYVRLMMQECLGLLPRMYVCDNKMTVRDNGIGPLVARNNRVEYYVFDGYFCVVGSNFSFENFDYMTSSFEDSTEFVEVACPPNASKDMEIY